MQSSVLTLLLRCMCAQVLRDLVKVIRPNVNNEQVRNWNLRFLLRLDGVQQQQRLQPVCTLPTGTTTATCANQQWSRTHVQRCLETACLPPHALCPEQVVYRRQWYYTSNILGVVDLSKPGHTVCSVSTQ